MIREMLVKIPRRKINPQSGSAQSHVKKLHHHVFHSRLDISASNCCNSKATGVEFGPELPLINYNIGSTDRGPVFKPAVFE